MNLSVDIQVSVQLMGLKPKRQNGALINDRMLTCLPCSSHGTIMQKFM